jgi:hypothetical protein
MLRLAVNSADDAVVFRFLNGTWISEDLEPVDIHLCWERQFAEAAVSIEDCICPRELAAQLIRLLLNGDQENVEGAQGPPRQPEPMYALPVV